MKTKILFSIAIIFYGVFAAPAQTWTPTGAPNKPWYAIASSADGQRLIAAANSANSPYAGPIYTSTNSGTTWVSNIVTLQSWACVASSADGQILAAAGGNFATGPIYVSTNGGSTWLASGAPIRYWHSLAMSADGSKIIAAVYSGSIYRSTNFGIAWVTNGLEGARALVSSADGMKLAAAIGNAVFTPSNFGNSWSSNNVGAPFGPLNCLAASCDGTRMAAGIGGNGGFIYLSTNSGVSWASNNVRLVWASIASTTDGIKMVAAGYPSIYTSTNLGATWTSNNVPRLNWSSVASSADGNKLVAASTSGGIYTLQSTPTPAIGITSSNGAVAFSWTIPSTNFVLQQSSDLANWSDVTNTPVLNLTNLQNQITLPASATNTFFRLKTP